MSTRYLLPLLLFVACQPPTDETPEVDRPNIIIILADDMGYSDLGCYGGEIRTPHLDRLAEGGLRYRQFYNAARCCPTRASLLTGSYPHSVGMGGMVSLPERGAATPGPYQGYLRHDLPTVAELLRDAGYATYMSGKWHVGEAPEHWPHRRGFDRYFGLISGASSYYTIRKDQNRERRMVLDSTRWEPPQEDWYATTAYSDFAVERVREHDPDRPFFLYLAYTAPHWPLHAPEETVRSYDGTYDAGWEPLRRARFARQRELGMRDDRYVFPEAAEEVPAWEDFADQKDWIRKMQVYAAMVEEMDKGIGRLVVELAATGQLDNTLILFLSDNGGCAETVGGRKLNKPGSTIGGKGSYVAYGPPGAFLSNVPFRKYKKWVDEGGIATPLIAHWPAGMGLDARGEWRDDVGHVIDLLPTALDAAGLPGKKAFPGRSLLPSFPGQPPADDRVLYWEHFGQQAVRSGPWKLSRNIPEAPWRLFNLAEDPTEVLDVADRQPELIDSLDEAFTEWAHDIGVKGFLDGDDR